MAFPAGRDHRGDAESASVRLTWSFGPGPATGGSGGRPPGLRPVFSAFSARASSFASYSARSRSRRSRARASITALASLTFENLGGGSDDETFADGLTEGVIAEL